MKLSNRKIDDYARLKFLEYNKVQRLMLELILLGTVIVTVTVKRVYSKIK